MNTKTFSSMLIFAAGVSVSALAVGAQDTMQKFNDLDQNRDGYIDKSEASSDVMLRERWVNVDVDGNEKINYQEFQRFETAPNEAFPTPKD